MARRPAGMGGHRRLSLGTLLCALAACAAPLRTGEVGRRAQPQERAALCAAWARAPTRQVQAVSGELRIRHDGQGERFRGKALFWLARPNRLRLHVLGPQGSPLLVVAASDGGSTLVDMAAARVQRAGLDAASMDHLLPLAPLHLDAAQWVALLLGEVAWPEEADDVVVGELHRLAWRQGEQALRLWVDPATGLWCRLEVAPDGREGWSAEVDARDAAGLPRGLRVTAPGPEPDRGQITTELRLREVEVNPTLAPGAFKVVVPKGFTQSP